MPQSLFGAAAAIWLSAQSEQQQQQQEAFAPKLRRGAKDRPIKKQRPKRKASYT